MYYGISIAGQVRMQAVLSSSGYTTPFESMASAGFRCGKPAISRVLLLDAFKLLLVWRPTMSADPWQHVCEARGVRDTGAWAARMAGVGCSRGSWGGSH